MSLTINKVIVTAKRTKNELKLRQEFSVVGSQTSVLYHNIVFLTYKKHPTAIYLFI